MDGGMGRRGRARGWLAGALAAAGLAGVPAAAFAARTVVTLSFDDERITQVNALPILDEFGVKASFFINTSRVGRSGRLTWDQLRALRDAGHEIGGHTLDHVDLTEVSDAEATRQVCDDRAALVAQGFDPISFAYPFGHADADADAAAIVGGCGYRFARAHGGIRTPTGCSSCPTAEPIPPTDPLRLRSSRSVQETDDLGYLQDRVLLAETTGGWINVNLHDVCDSCDTYSIRPELLREFLAWLTPRAASHDTVVLPMGRAFATDATPPKVVLTAPQHGDTVAGAVPLAAEASDETSVARVEFLVNGTVVATDTASPYAASWDSRTVANGVSTVAARAVDGAGNAAVSLAAEVLVDNPPIVDPPPQPIAFELPFGSVWKYWDAGTDPGAAWSTVGFDDAGWASGPGQLGYGDGDEATVLRRTTPRQPSVYFRRVVSLPGTPTTAGSATIRYDDGFALYVNGTLVATRNVGSLAHSAYATGNAENVLRTVTVPAGLLRAGNNTIAVMIKQKDSRSSDISFDLQLRVTVQ